MTTYRPYTKEDKLEVGTKIRLGGREGEIARMNEDERYLYGIVFANDPVVCNLDLAEFTFEIEDIPLPPLKIDKRVKEKLKEIIEDEDEYPSESLRQVMAPWAIQSLESILKEL